MTDKIIGLAKEAGAKILEYYSDEIEVTHKGDDSPLTKADLAAHHHIVAGLKTLQGKGVVNSISLKDAFETLFFTNIKPESSFCLQ